MAVLAHGLSALVAGDITRIHTLLEEHQLQIVLPQAQHQILKLVELCTIFSVSVKRVDLLSKFSDVVVSCDANSALSQHHPRCVLF